ncbi:hypothetical protein Acr_01g0014560 [Actinidia rufa]|uniref:Uncharacterized protein n=1 Tax=Actinidia rufa TaxID=165716 RepID=A0A7J0E5D5_9ERIC|nr:hypothetical protein Acr_01g0014560 [Actinidia rufa]
MGCTGWAGLMWAAGLFWAASELSYSRLGLHRSRAAWESRAGAACWWRLRLVACGLQQRTWLLFLTAQGWGRLRNVGKGGSTEADLVGGGRTEIAQRLDRGGWWMCGVWTEAGQRRIWVAQRHKCILELSQGLNQITSNLGDHVKAAFGSSWKEVLCEKQLLEGKIDPGNPALLVISLSALRSLELLRGLRALTGECPAAKLFSKHMKIEVQASSLKSRVNIASGTPSRLVI